MTISRDDSIGIVGAGLSGLLLANQLIARGYEVTLFGEKDNRNQLLGSWRNAATPSPQKHYVLGIGIRGNSNLITKNSYKKVPSTIMKSLTEKR